MKEKLILMMHVFEYGRHRKAVTPEPQGRDGDDIGE
jgi:hypothetical protein